MKSKKETINKLRDLILASEGKSLKYYYCNYERKSISREDIDNKGFHKDCGVFPMAMSNPIILERVLRALGKVDKYWHCWLHTQDRMAFTIDREKKELFFWTLCLPAHEQEEETLQALIDILTPTQ